MPLRVLLAVCLFGICLWLESRRPLRKITQAKTRRVFVNVSLAVIGAVILRAAFYPVMLMVSEKAEIHKWGVLPSLGLPLAVELLLAFMVLEYTHYWWHQMLHKMPLLWRFHNVHHIDLDLDTSTALRFHFGELIISTFYRSAQIVIIGVSPLILLLFETAVTSFAQFHHSNIRVPFRFEQFLSYFIITPRMHGIHHSVVRDETDSNFGTIFTFWDRLHRTFRWDVPQEEIKIGVPSYQNPSEQTFWKCLIFPFQKQRPWQLDDKKIPG